MDFHIVIVLCTQPNIQHMVTEGDNDAPQSMHFQLHNMHSVHLRFGCTFVLVGRHHQLLLALPWFMQAIFSVSHAPCFVCFHKQSYSQNRMVFVSSPTEFPAPPRQPPSLLSSIRTPMQMSSAMDVKQGPPRMSQCFYSPFTCAIRAAKKTHTVCCASNLS